jgi:hypothetical protein
VHQSYDLGWDLYDEEDISDLMPCPCVCHNAPEEESGNSECGSKGERGEEEDVEDVEDAEDIEEAEEVEDVEEEVEYEDTKGVTYSDADSEASREEYGSEEEAGDEAA